MEKDSQNFSLFFKPWSIMLNIRHLCSVAVRRAPLKDKESIGEIFRSSSWSVKELMSANDSVINETEISDETVLKMLKLSGFRADVDAAKVEAIKRALKLQMGFVSHLYDDNQVITKESSNDSMFRLLASDHIQQNPTTLESLLREIEELPLKVDPEKAETGFDIKKLNQKHKTHFTVKVNSPE